jgi:hypothetical protein
MLGETSHNLPALIGRDGETIINWQKAKEVSNYFAISYVIQALIATILFGPSFFLYFLIFFTSGLFGLSAPKPKKLLTLEQEIRDKETNESLIKQQKDLDEKLLQIDDDIEQMYENEFHSKMGNENEFELEGYSSMTASWSGFFEIQKTPKKTFYRRRSRRSEKRA